MNTEEKKDRIRELVIDMLNDSHTAMIGKVGRVLKSGAIDIDSWDEEINPMIIPKCIITAILQNESHQYEGKGTSFEKQVKKEVKNINYFL